MLETISRVVEESGIWSEGRRNSHAFLLSPSVFRISETQKQELSSLGFALTNCLLGLSHMAEIAYNPFLNYKGDWKIVRRVFSTGVPSVYRELQGMNIRDIPRLLKVDLMVDQDGRFRIAEIDGHNKHGVGYSTLAMRVRRALNPDAKVLPGVVKMLAGEVRRLGFNEVKLFYADQERFYVPEFRVAREEFARFGVTCYLLGEMDVKPDSLEEGLFVDLPFLNHRIELYDRIIPAYKEGRAKFIIPPKPFMGAKGALAILRNDARDEQVEAILNALIDKKSLELVRSYIPKTWLVGKQVVQRDGVTLPEKYVLKESISSGMKGVFFSDEPDFGSALRVANEQNLNWIMQEEVRNQPQTFQWFNGDSDPEIAEDWFMRVTVHYVARQLADIVVTATRNRAVHGGKQCLQLGTVVE